MPGVMLLTAAIASWAAARPEAKTGSTYAVGDTFYHTVHDDIMLRYIWCMYIYIYIS